MSAITETPTRLDLGCGASKQEGFFGVDFSDHPDCQADLRLDLNRYPWPFETSSIEEVHCSHYVEHIPHWRPWFDDYRPGVDGFYLFADELWRVLKPDGKAKIMHPYAFSTRGSQDQSHERFINEVSWQYLNAAWRQQIGIGHYPMLCDFEISVGNSWMRPEKWSDAVRTPEAIGEAAIVDINIVADLFVTLRALKG